MRKELSSKDAASTLFHEMSHWKHSESVTREESLQEEIDVRVEEDQFRIANDMPPSQKDYRTKDGKTDRSAIDKSIRNSPHYNPTNRKRIGRRYVGDKSTSGWCPP